jgi:hypothetical protein
MFGKIFVLPGDSQGWLLQSTILHDWSKPLPRNGVLAAETLMPRVN